MGRRRKSSGLTGVLVIDKPAGVTSHDVVQQVRRRLREPRVGHAGTLDPMATGVLVVMVGEATKLAPYLTADDKTYRAMVQLGAGTDTLDAEGEVTETGPLPDWWASENATATIDGALAEERRRREQRPPAYSAIKVKGRSAHARVRAGEQVELEPRSVTVHALALEERDLEAGRITLTLTVSKGFYVRSLARDLGEGLGVPCHLAGLQRLRSGAFTIEEAVAPEAEDLLARLQPMARAAERALAVARLTESGAQRARHGGPMAEDDFVTPPPADEPSVWLDPEGRLVAIGRSDARGAQVSRGFSAPPVVDEPEG